MPKDENLTIEQCKDPNIGFKLLEHLVADFEPKIEIANEMYNKLKESPENVYCVIAKYFGYTAGFLFAYIVDKTVLIRQGRAMLPFINCSKEIMDNLIDWARNKGVSSIEIRVKKQKLRAYYHRQYNFMPIDDKTMKLEI